MNEFLFWCRYPLIPLLFHDVTSLHHPSFQRNDFSTCSTYLSVSEDGAGASVFEETASCVDS